MGWTGAVAVPSRLWGLGIAPSVGTARAATTSGPEVSLKSVRMEAIRCCRACCLYSFTYWAFRRGEHSARNGRGRGSNSSCGCWNKIWAGFCRARNFCGLHSVAERALKDWYPAGISSGSSPRRGSGCACRWGASTTIRIGTPPSPAGWWWTTEGCAPGSGADALPPTRAPAVRGRGGRGTHCVGPPGAACGGGRGARPCGAVLGRTRCAGGSSARADRGLAEVGRDCGVTRYRALGKGLSGGARRAFGGSARMIGEAMRVGDTGLEGSAAVGLAGSWAGGSSLRRRGGTKGCEVLRSRSAGSGPRGGPSAASSLSRSKGMGCTSSGSSLASSGTSGRGGGREAGGTGIRWAATIAWCTMSPTQGVPFTSAEAFRIRSLIWGRTTDARAWLVFGLVGKTWSAGHIRNWGCVSRGVDVGSTKSALGMFAG
mmetsp:Transcript_139517/g.242712  ORF Transcript_139517/g.242712 Transcript_139517/m.242712 type:complete len:429 (+) Transcript_139517:2734-4020(+)